MSDTTIVRLQSCLDSLHRGDTQARDELINLACERLTVLTRKMLNEFPRLRRWEQTDDVFQNSAMRLRRSLQSVTPGSVREFFGLAATQIRRELIDLSRRYYGRATPGGSPGTFEPPAAVPERSPVHFEARGAASEADDMKTPEGADQTYDPSRIVQWAEFHAQVATLPPDEREVVELLWYQELTQEQAAELLGVDKSTVKRRWRSARMSLHDVLKHWLFEE